MKVHSTPATSVQSNLLWNCDKALADRICNPHRRRSYAEPAGYWENTTFLSSIPHDKCSPITFFDANTGKALFTAPVGRSWEDFLQESRRHGWPSFRQQEVHWECVHVLAGGKMVSKEGTHLGQCLGDQQGRYFCINLVSIAGRPRGKEIIKA